MFGGIQMVTKKDRRHSGYVTPRATISKKSLIENDLLIDIFYDDWEDYRDGFRDYLSDYKKIKKIRYERCKPLDDGVVQKRIRMNNKQKELLKRRKARKLWGPD